MSTPHRPPPTTLPAATPGRPLLAEPVLAVRNLHKRFGQRVVLAGVSFAVEAGTLVGLVGENGAGKSTTLKLVAGELAPSGGEVRLWGALGYCPQRPILNEGLTPDQHLAYFRAAYGLPDLAYARALAARLRLDGYARTPVARLSEGTRQKLNLLLALMHRPRLLLLDEPYQGFDWETYQEFWRLAEELRRDGAGLLVISHMFFERQRFDRLYHLRHGRLVDAGGDDG